MLPESRSLCEKACGGARRRTAASTAATSAAIPRQSSASCAAWRAASAYSSPRAMSSLRRRAPSGLQRLPQLAGGSPFARASQPTHALHD